MTVTRHWLAYRDRWKDAPKVITPRDDDDVAEWRRLGYRVEGPFVPADQLKGAVEALKSIAFSDDHDHPELSASDLRTRAFVAWKTATGQGGGRP